MLFLSCSLMCLQCLPRCIFSVNFCWVNEWVLFPFYKKVLHYIYLWALKLCILNFEGFFLLFSSILFYFVVVQVQLSPFSPQHSPCPTHLYLLNPTLLWLCPCVLYTCSLMNLPLFSPIMPPPSPVVTVSLFFISMSLVIFYSLVCFVD